MEESTEPVADPRTIGRWPIRVDRVIQTTITLLAVLIIYDGWEKLSLAGVISVIVGPLLAICLSHVFAAALANRVTTGRAMSARERRGVWTREGRLLLLGVPPLLLLLLLSAFGVTYTDAIRVIVLVGVLSLGFWGGLAARRAGLSGWPFVASVLYGLCLGGLMLVLQAILQPGTHPFQP